MGASIELRQFAELPTQQQNLSALQQSRTLVGMDRSSRVLGAGVAEHRTEPSDG